MARTVRLLASAFIPAALALACAVLLSAKPAPAYELRVSYGGHVYAVDHGLTADDCAAARDLQEAYALPGHAYTCTLES